MRKDHRSSTSTDVKLPKQSVNLRRRGFLFAAGAGAVGASVAPVAAAAGGAGQGAAAPPTDARGYRESEHVRDYYRTARI